MTADAPAGASRRMRGARVFLSLGVAGRAVWDEAAADRPD